MLNLKNNLALKHIIEPKAIVYIVFGFFIIFASGLLAKILLKTPVFNLKGELFLTKTRVYLQNKRFVRTLIQVLMKEFAFFSFSLLTKRQSCIIFII